MTREFPVSGAGLGLRRSMLDECMTSPPEVDFMEVAPENWLGAGGMLAHLLPATGKPLVLVSLPHVHLSSDTADSIK